MRDGRGLVELIIVILIVGIIVGIFVLKLVENLDEARRVALQNQLTNIKYAVELYTLLEGHYPDDLRLLNKRCNFSREDSLYGRRYLEHQVLDSEGYPVDPYGSRFIYDNESGNIKRGVR